MPAYMEVALSLSPENMKKLAKGHTIQLKHSQIAPGAQHKHKLVMSKKNAMKIMRAGRNGKQVRLSLSSDEIEGSGVLDWFKKAGRFVKDKIIDTQFYQDNLRPLARKGVDMLVDSFVPVPARDLARKGVDFVGDKTKAFGLPQSLDGSMSLAQKSMITEAQKAIAYSRKPDMRAHRKGKLPKGSGIYRS